MNNRNIGKLAMLASVSLYAFNNQGGWKLDADGKIEMKDGNPVWVDANGGERVMDGQTITRLNGEAATLRRQKETAETALAKYSVDGKPIDAEAAIKALDTVGKLDAKKLIDAGEVDTVRRQISDQFTAQLTEKDKALTEALGKIDSMTIGGLFTNSQFIKDKVAMPLEFFEANFRKHFEMDGGKVVAKDKAGNRLMSKQRIGEYAEGDEVFELLIADHPQKDAILKADNHNGSGNGGGGGNRQTNARKISRSEFDTASPQRQAEIGAQIRKGEVTISD